MSMKEDDGKAERDSDLVSVNSTTTRSSLGSIGSRASAAAAKMRRGLSSLAQRSSKSTDSANLNALADLKEGDVLETIALVTVREDENLDSNVVSELQVGTTLQVMKVAGRRVKVSYGLTGTFKECGWVSYKTKIDEPLLLKCSDDVHLHTMDFDVGGRHEVKALVTVRADEDLESEYITELAPGCTITIQQLGSQNKRRVKVSSAVATGWISTSTKVGEPLIGKMMDTPGGPSVHYVSTGSKVRSMLEAARSGNLDQLSKVVDGGTGVVGKFASKPRLNSCDVRGKTALIYAAAFGNRDIVKYLLTKKEVDVNASDDTKKCALHHAANRRRHTEDPFVDQTQGEVVEMLLRHGAYMEARDHKGCVALMFAAANGWEQVVSELLSAMANVNVKDYEGHRPLDYAIFFEHGRVARLLMEHGGTGHEYAPNQASPAGRPVQTAEGGQQNIEAVWLMNQAALRPGDGTSPAAASQGTREAPIEEEPEEGAAAGAQDATLSPSESAGRSTGTKPKKKVIKKKASTAYPDGSPTSVDASPAASAGTEEAPQAKAAGKAKAKKKAKAEGKKAAAKKPRTVAMMEAVGDQEAMVNEEMCVEDMPKEDVDMRVRALAKLKMVVESGSSPGELEMAIKVAQQEGAGADDLKEASARLNELKIRFAVRDSLLQATRNRDVAELEKAIRDAQDIKLSGAELDGATKVLAKEKPRQAARDKLNDAKDSGDTKKLKKALKDAKDAKLDDDELAEYVLLLVGAESREKAQATLTDAIAAKDVSRLKFSIEQAKEAGVGDDLIKSAEAVLAVEEPKHQARSGLEDAIAVEEGRKDALEKAIAFAKRVGLGEPEQAEAIQALRKEEKKDRLLAGVFKLVDDSMAVDQTDADALKEIKDKLSDAIKDAIKMGVKESDLAQAEIRRKRVHNMVEDLKGSIRVFARIRPFNSKEKEAGDTMITKQTDSMTLCVGNAFENTYKFDAVFTPGTQDEIFEDCKDLVQSAFDGYNVTLFAYGQTGAGKTFTMAGVKGMLGVTPRTIQEVFKVAESQKDRFEYTIEASMLELWKENLVDLLVKGNPAAAKHKLKIREDKTGDVSVEHLTEQQVQTAAELEVLVDRGTESRAVAATSMNSESSRSHLVLIVKINSVNKATQETRRGKLYIVDLAGSERLGKSQVTGDAQKESIEINKSLTALGDVIEALTKRAKVVPYRNHKLTMLMQDSLGGEAKTLMFVNCSPASSNLEETVNSLKYAQRAKNITNNITLKK